MNSSPNRDAALALASQGLHIFPCNPDKTPKIAAWEQNATSNGLNIEVTWQSAPHLMPAIPVGAHSLVVIDADRKAGAADGVAAFDFLCAAHGVNLAGAFVVETPSGGRHYYFSSETAFSNSRGSLPDGIDVRGVGGYVIAPGATLPDGRNYKLIAGSWDSIPALPEPLAALLRQKRTTATPEAYSPPGGLAVTDRERAFAQAALEDEVAKLTAMREGSGRNRALNDAAHSLGTMAGWIDLNTVANALWEASIANGYIAKDGESAAKQTIESGMNAGASKPRPLLAGKIPDIDISAMIANGIAAFKQRQTHSAFRIEDIKSPFTYDSKGIEFAINGLIPLGAITLLSGDSGCGKTTLITKLADAIAEGKAILGNSPCVRRDVLYLDRENTLPVIRERLIRLRIRAEGKFKYWGGHVTGDVPMPMSSEVKEWIMRTEPKPVLFIDSFIAFLEGNENSSTDVRAFMQPLRELTNLGAAVVVLHHTGKGESTQDFRGSSDIKAAIDVGYLMKNNGESRLTTLTLKSFKARFSVIDALGLTYSNGEFIPQEIKQASEDILTQLLRDNANINKSEFETMARRKGMGQGSIRKFIDAGLTSGMILSRKGERNASLLSLAETLFAAH
jgi:energy-coupling factor transporter ATP-binding protein EcfA2